MISIWLYHFQRPLIFKDAIIHAFISSRLVYSHALYPGISYHNMRRVQLIQNPAGRLLTHNKRSDHNVSVLATLHWLSDGFRIDFKPYTVHSLPLSVRCWFHMSLRSSSMVSSSKGSFSHWSWLNLCVPRPMTLKFPLISITANAFIQPFSVLSPKSVYARSFLPVFTLENFKLFLKLFFLSIFNFYLQLYWHLLLLLLVL